MGRWRYSKIQLGSSFSMISRCCIMDAVELHTQQYNNNCVYSIHQNQQPFDSNHLKIETIEFISGLLNRTLHSSSTTTLAKRNESFSWDDEEWHFDWYFHVLWMPRNTNHSEVLQYCKVNLTDRKARCKSIQSITPSWSHHSNSFNIVE